MTTTEAAPCESASIAGEPVIHLDDIVMSYGSKHVLKGVSFDVRVGEKIALLGPNGAGKSTLIEIMAGLRAPTSGEARICGHNPLSDSRYIRQNVGLMLQNWKDHGKWVVSEFLHYIARAHGQVHADMNRILGALDLVEQRNTRLDALSGGQRRRVDVAAALMGDPMILIVDEPTTGFDVESRKSFQQAVRELAEDKTVLWATHDLGEAEDICDRIIMLSRGAIVADGSPAELREFHGSYSRISWRDGSGATHVVNEVDPNPVIVEVASTPGVSDIEVRTRSLEDIYLEVIRGTDKGRALD